MSLSGFGMRIILVSKNELGSIPSPSILWKNLFKIGIISFLDVWAASSL